MMRNISSPQCEAWPSINRPDCFAVSSSRCPSARMSGCEDEWPTIPPMSALITLIVTIKEHLRYFNWGECAARTPTMEIACMKSPAHSSDTVNGDPKGVKEQAVREPLRIRITFLERRQHLPGVAVCELEPFFASGPFGSREKGVQLLAQPFLLLAADVFV